MSGIEIATKVRIGKLPDARHIAADRSTTCSEFDFYELRVSLAIRARPVRWPDLIETRSIG